MSRLRIFLVEDNPLIRENLIEIFAEWFSSELVGWAATEAEAVDWLKTHPEQWNLAVVDLFLRQGNGLTILKALQDRLPHQKIVVLSNYATEDIRRRCAQLGADAAFDKSAELEEFRDFALQNIASLPCD